MIIRFNAVLVAIVGVAYMIVSSQAFAQPNQEPKRNIGIMAGGIGTTTARLAEDLSRTMSGKSGVQIRAMLGKGSEQSINDLLYLRGVDLAFVNADILANIRITKPNHPALGNLAYLAKVTDSELHLLVRKDSDINDIYDLETKKISVGNKGSGSALTSRLVMRILGIKTSAAFMSATVGLDELRRGTLEAVFFVGAKPLPLLLNIREDDELKLVGIPFSSQLASIYQQSEFLVDDYPTIVENKFVPTLSVPVILAVYNKFAKGSFRHNNLIKFSEDFLDDIPLLQQPPRHPKWKDLDLTATVEGWKRFTYFEDVLVR